MKIGFRSKSLTLGIDLGSFSIKAVKLQRKSSGFKAVKVAHARFASMVPPGDEEIISHLKNLLDRNGLRKEEASLLLPGREISVRFFSLPKMPRDELAQAVVWEASKHTSLPPEDLVTDFVSGEPVQGSSGGQHPVMAVMAPRAGVERWVESLAGIGLRLAAIDIPPMALLAYCDLADPWSRGCFAMLDLGHTKTGIHLFQDRQLRFTRDIAIGGSDITQALDDVLHVDPAHAENLKERLGVLGEGQEGEKVRQIIEQVLERIAVEVQRSFDYYQAQSRETVFTGVRLVGGTARLPGIAHYFSEALRLETTVDRPWQVVPLAPDVEREAGIPETGPIFTAAIGLATRRGSR